MEEAGYKKQEGKFFVFSSKQCRQVAKSILLESELALRPGFLPYCVTFAPNSGPLHTG